MRVLYSSTPMEGVLAPGLPVARALRDAGHDVVIAVAADLTARAEADGFDVVAAGPTAAESAMRAFADPWVAAAPPEEQWRLGATMFSAVMAPEKLPALRALADRWHPDIVVHAAVDLAAPIVAAERGVPSVTYGFALVLEPALLDAMAQRVAPLWRDAGLEPAPHGGLFGLRYLDPAPTSLQSDRGPATAVAVAVRPTIADDPRAPVPPWLGGLGRRPVVYVSLGTVPIFNQPSTFTTLLAELASEDVDLIVTIGNTNDPSSLGAQPANVHVERWLPLAPVLPLCDVVVCHAGAGTTLAALSHGIPLVLTPQGADQFVTADACARAGVARVLGPAELNPRSARDAAIALLGATKERAAAERLRGEIDAMPSASAVARDLEVLLVNN